MTRRTHIVMACVLLGVGLVLAIPLALGAGSPRGWIDSHYHRVSRDTRADSAIYTSRQPPSQVVDEITDRWDPYQHLNDPTGYFLRYNNLIVRVSAKQGGGAKIRVTDARHGYHLWGPLIIGSWGTFHGRGPGFRGGGPGAGK